MENKLLTISNLARSWRLLRALLFVSIVFILLFLSVLSISAARPGDLDLSFGIGGHQMTLIGMESSGNAVVIQPDGKIIVAGGSRNAPFDQHSGDFALARYKIDGSIDISFGNGGTVVTAIGNGYDVANAVAVQADGKILVAGTAEGMYDWDFALVRYNTDGSLDSSFGNAGKVVTPVGYNYDIASAIAVQPDGKIVVAGYIGIGWDYDTNSALLRYNANGSLDTSFGNGGKVVDLSNINDDAAYAVVIQPDGKIVTAGNLLADFLLTRYNSNGSPDLSFGTIGRAVTDMGGVDEGYGIALQPDGNILTVGNSYTGVYPGFINRIAITRHNGHGTLDPTFGSGGKVQTVFDGSSDTPGAVVVQTNGKIIVGGYDGTDNYVLALNRYNKNGTLDASFGSGGSVRTTLSGNDAAVKALAIQADGKIVAAGLGYKGDAGGFVVARFLAEPNIKLDFDGDGRSDAAVFRPSDSIWYLDRSTSGFAATQFGLSNDQLTPADYDGDGKTDISVFRDGVWYWINSSNSSFSTVSFGSFGDIPQPVDFTGDGRAELAVYRGGNWWMFDLANGQVRVVQFGLPTDMPYAADYDGDGRVDQAVYRNGTWYINGSTAGFYAFQYGLPTDIPVPADYDGDGKTDPAVYRGGTWYLLQSTLGAGSFQFGLATDIPSPADYDGDGKDDPTVFRSSSGDWYQLRSTQGFSQFHFGATGDKPVKIDPTCPGCWDY